MSIYKFIRPFLFAIDSERAHNMMVMLGTFVSKLGLTGVLEKIFRFDDKRLALDVFGLHFKNPVGLAAGFDKNARLIDFLPALGFGFIEIGTIPLFPQPGNPKPRIFRLENDKALLNRLGFNSEGATQTEEQLAKTKCSIPLGINIGKNKDVPNEQAIENYAKSFLLLAPHANYVTVNVSSPNTPNLRALQDKEPLLALLTRLNELNSALPRPLPILLKIAPDLTNEALDDICAVAKETQLAGIIATNTTISREGLHLSLGEITALGVGGISGKPVHKRSVEVVRYVYRKLAGKVPIIGVGGIFTAEDAYEMICAGASLVQVYTGMIYEGPGMVKRLKQGLIELLERDGFTTIAEAVGQEPAIVVV